MHIQELRDEGEGGGRRGGSMMRRGRKRGARLGKEKESERRDDANMIARCDEEEER